MDNGNDRLIKKQVGSHARDMDAEVAAASASRIRFPRLRAAEPSVR